MRPRRSMRRDAVAPPGRNSNLRPDSWLDLSCEKAVGLSKLNDGSGGEPRWSPAPNFPEAPAAPPTTVEGQSRPVRLSPLARSSSDRADPAHVTARHRLGSV